LQLITDNSASVAFQALEIRVSGTIQTGTLENSLRGNALPERSVPELV
jgi:hypothetical protein